MSYILSVASSFGEEKLSTLNRSQCCCEKALEFDPESSCAWNNLGVCDGGKVRGIAHSKQKCFEKGLEFDPKNSDAWNNPGVCDGGKVRGIVHSKQSQQLTTF